MEGEVKGREREGEGEGWKSGEGGKEDEEVVKPWAGGRRLAHLGRTRWIVLGPALTS